MKEKKSVPPHRMTLEKFTAESIKDFRRYLADDRKNSASTRNQRMGAIHSFVRFLQYECPEKILQWQRIQMLPKQKSKSKPVQYVPKQGIAALLSVINTNSRKGIRDNAMLLVLYDTGARVQELADITVKDVRLGIMPVITLSGKGRKKRIVPLMPTTAQILDKYMKTFDLYAEGKENEPLFRNRKGEKFSRFGVGYILHSYCDAARMRETRLPKRISPHVLRHSKAMHLLEDGCTAVVIQHILGHADLRTTGVYVKSNTEMTRSALEKVNDESQPPEVLSWLKNDDDILTWLENL